MPAIRTDNPRPTIWGHPRFRRVFNAICTEHSTRRRLLFNELLDHHPTLSLAVHLHECASELDRSARRFHDISRDADQAADDARRIARLFHDVATEQSFLNGQAEPVLRELELRLEQPDNAQPDDGVPEDLPDLIPIPDSPLFLPDYHEDTPQHEPTPPPAYYAPSPDPTEPETPDDLTYLDNPEWRYCAFCDTIREPHSVAHCLIDLTRDDEAAI